jgi:hypothetical protein
MVALATLLLTPSKGLPKERKLRGKKRDRFRLCFADFLVNYIDENPHFLTVLYARERDLFRAMQLRFLDFFMADTCRSIDEIRASGKKALDCMIDGRSGTVPDKYPMTANTYIAYLDEVEGEKVQKSTISNFQSQFRKYFQGILRL